jgi:hypothetical protein
MKPKTLTKLSAIIDKLNIDVSAIDIQTIGKSSREAMTEAGLNLMYTAIRNLHKCEAELIDLIAYTKGITPLEAEDADVIAFVKDLFAQEGIVDFFK